jgi:hypothetical protein
LTNDPRSEKTYLMYDHFSIVVAAPYIIPLYPSNTMADPRLLTAVLLRYERVKLLFNFRLARACFQTHGYQLGRRMGPLLPRLSYRFSIDGRLFGNVAWPQTTIMSASPPHFTELPTEVSERILQHLPSQDIIKMEAVWPNLTCGDAVFTLCHMI